MRTAQTSNGKRQRARDRDRERDREHVQGKFKSKGRQNNSNNNAGQGHLSRVACAQCASAECGAAPAVILKSNNYKQEAKYEKKRRHRRREVAARGNCQVRCPTSVVVLDRQRRNAARHTGAYTVICMCCTPFRCHSPSHIRTHTHTTHTHLRTHSSTLDS